MVSPFPARGNALIRFATIINEDRYRTTAVLSGGFSLFYSKMFCDFHSDSRFLLPRLMIFNHGHPVVNIDLL